MYILYFSQTQKQLYCISLIISLIYIILFGLLDFLLVQYNHHEAGHRGVQNHRHWIFQDATKNCGYASPGNHRTP